MKNKHGYFFFFIHMIIEITCFYLLSSYVDFKYLAILSFVYDYLAFIPQGIVGYLIDIKIKIPALLIGIILSSLAIILAWTKINPFVVIVFVATASTFIHIDGAEKTIRESNGKMTPLAMFVGGGSFGVVLGKVLYQISTPIWLILIINLLMLIVYFYYKKHPVDYNKELPNFNFHNQERSRWVIIVFSTLVVAARSYIGYGIPQTWNKETYQMILLFTFMGTGKVLGGVLVDKFGIRFTTILSTLVSIPLLIFGDTQMIISIIGVMMFSFTMAITAAILLSTIKKYPGVAFGFTTLGLFMGTLPLFIFRIKDKMINIIVIVLISIICCVLLWMISKPKEKKNQTQIINPIIE